MFRMRSGSIIGRDHLKAMKNCQDGYCAKEVAVLGSPFRIGVVSDGCGDGNHNEVAATLLPAFIASDISLLLASGVSVQSIPDILYPRVVDFLRSIFRFTVYAPAGFNEATNFVVHYLLATVVGFVVGPADGVVFVSGDGVVGINKEIMIFDKENRPDYMGYHLVPRSSLDAQASLLPEAFFSMSLKTVDVAKIFVATDGLTKELAIDPGVAEVLWSNTKHPRGVQRWLNSLSMNEHRFKDDTTIVAIEREEEDASTDS